MASNTNYAQEYEQAEKAYLERDFESAAEIIDRLVHDFPEDPRALLLRGQIYGYGFQDYQLAQQHYQKVLNLTDEPELIDFAQNGIEQLVHLQIQSDFNLDQPNYHNSSDHQPEFTEDEDDYSLDLDEDSFSPENISEPDFKELESDSSYVDSIEYEGDGGQLDFEQIESELDSNPDEQNFYHSEPELASDFTDADNETREHSDNPFAEMENPETEAPEANLADSIDPNMLEDSFDWQSQPERDQTNGATPSEWTEETQIIAADNDVEPALGSSDSDFQTPAAKNEENYSFDDIDNDIFELEDIEQELPDTILFTSDSEPQSSEIEVSGSNSLIVENEPEPIMVSEGSPISENLDPSGWLDNSTVEPQASGPLGFFQNASISKKQLLTAIATGVVSTVAVGIVGLGFDLAGENRNLPKTGFMALVAGAAGFGTSWALGSITSKQIKIATEDLQAQFESVYQGNLNAKAKVHSQDELGHLASQFNRMAQVILTTTGEAQRRAEETEQAKEDLQRQVIRLLDDVEGAARGDLTVQATVTADVLGAVADAFNLTIQSLKEIVAQVKQAAEDVNKGSRDSEKYARDQSSDALRMAEELAVTLNSVQMMTESIQRVAENAREAEEVARTSSLTAVKGGQAVERTVSGILQIRDTVSETARKVKRLAEASQEISKIVLIISGVAERTNQLALNASIQAAKAGEAGRGFAVVADEVRQLADRAGKALREIEQIVLQIQSETGSVMTAMEEGIQEVIDVTDRADQAKKALDDIIQVSNHIDNLVSSITADTVKQRENSLAVAQVMQSVEMTAQGTSQESQRVAGSLSNLVDISQNLLSSVEKFRIDG